uniref:SprT-like domain-containing protein n=1 Tax=Ditylenchus dipsaci TaxID=166011 RepID=A0A915DSR0_9BILA
MEVSSSSKKPIFDLADPTLELLDPTPDIFAQFVLFNEQFFFAKLGACTVEWSKRLTSCAGICQFHPRTGLCTIRLSEPLLNFDPGKTLLRLYL